MYSPKAGAQVTWHNATIEAPFSQRWQHQTGVYDNKIWLHGGVKVAPDLWSSANGTDWVKVCDSVQYPMRTGYIALSFKDKYWALGGSEG